MDKKSMSKGKDSSIKPEIKSSIMETHDEASDKRSTSALGEGDQMKGTKREISSTAAERSSKRTNIGVLPQGKILRSRRRPSVSTPEVESSYDKVIESENTSVAEAMDADDVGEGQKSAAEATERNSKRTSAAAKDAEVVSQKRRRTTSTISAGDKSNMDDVPETQSGGVAKSDSDLNIDEESEIPSDSNSDLEPPVSESNDENKEFSSEENEDENGEPTATPSEDNIVETPRQSVAEVINEFKFQAKVLVKELGEILEDLDTNLKDLYSRKDEVWTAIREMYKLVANPRFGIEEQRIDFEKRRLTLKTTISNVREPDHKITRRIYNALKKAIPSLCFLIAELEKSLYCANESVKKIEDVCVYLKGYNKDDVPYKMERVVIKPLERDNFFKFLKARESFESFFEVKFDKNLLTELDNQMDSSSKENNIEPVPLTYSAAIYIDEQLCTFQCKWLDILLREFQKLSKLHKDALANSMMRIDGDPVRGTYELLGMLSGKMLNFQAHLDSIEENYRFCMDVFERFQHLSYLAPSASCIPK